jgi:vacuolar-type H+-ATPase subunit I/STV1
LYPISILQQHEKEKLARISHLDKDKSQVQTAINTVVEQQKQAAEDQLQKVDVVTDNREKRLRELQEKMRAKEAHAAEVRRRKSLRVMTAIEDQVEYDLENTNMANTKMVDENAEAGTRSEQQTTEVTPLNREYNF